MSHSPLATVFVPANGTNYTAGRPGGRITKITVHHMAGILSAERCGQIFQTPGRGGSSHYGIGLNGEIGVYVEEENTAWTDSNWDSNIHSVTIENSNNVNGGNWSVSDATFNSLVKLCADIARRNGLGKLVPGQNLTWHSMYASTSCPGDYLRSKMNELANKANAINGAPAPAPAPSPTPGNIKVGDKVTLRSWVDYSGTHLIPTRAFYFVKEVSGNRAVLAADSIGGAIYAAVNTNNLVKIGGAPAPAPAPAKKSNEQIADEVIRGDWGNGQERANRLKAAGYDYNTIQAIVNQKLGYGGGSSPINIGDTVIVNGQGTAASNGTGLVTVNYSNQRMKVISIANGRYGCNQYNQDGGITGWWAASQVRKA